MEHGVGPRPAGSRRFRNDESHHLWPIDFASLPRPRDISTSAAPAPRSSTGSTSSTTAASSCCASRTPTARAAPRRARARSSRDSAGSASAGTRTSYIRERISRGIRPTRSACSPPTPRIDASARRRSSTRCARPPRRAATRSSTIAAATDSRPTKSRAASRPEAAVRRALPRARRRDLVDGPRPRTIKFANKDMARVTSSSSAPTARPSTTWRSCRTTSRCTSRS